MNQIQPFSIPSQSLTFRKVIDFLQNIQDSKNQINLTETNILQNEFDVLTQHNQHLQERFHFLKQQQITMQEDFHTFSSILNRAQEFIHDKDKNISNTSLAPIFEIDQDGKIEIIDSI